MTTYEGVRPRYDWIGRDELPKDRTVLNGFYVIEDWHLPRNEAIYAYGTTLLIHPLVLAAIDARMIVRREMNDVIQWLKRKGVEL